jgi:hypothetical protein
LIPIKADAARAAQAAQAMADRFPAWQCIGCGRIDGPQNCVGICRDRKVELVEAAALDRAEARIAALERVLRTLARTTPNARGWERSYLALQAQARRLLDD